MAAVSTAFSAAGQRQRGFDNGFHSFDCDFDSAAAQQRFGDCFDGGAVRAGRDRSGAGRGRPGVRYFGPYFSRPVEYPEKMPIFA